MVQTLTRHCGLSKLTEDQQEMYSIQGKTVDLSSHKELTLRL